MTEREGTDPGAVVIEPEKRPDSTIILMHGLGADGHDFEPLVSELDLPSTSSIRWVFPHAPARHVTLNAGYVMRAWYDIVSIERDALEDEPGIRESQKAIGALISAERDRGMPADRIALAGFSQGGAMALFTALRWPERLAGVAALSCYMPLPATLRAEAHPANKAASIFMAHGTEDPIVPFELGQSSRDLLLQIGCRVAWRTYPMGHSVCEDEVDALRDWLLEVLPPRSPSW